MDKLEDGRLLFEKQWGDKFESQPPAYENTLTEDDILKRISSVKEKIRKLELELEKEKFELQFLETQLLAHHTTDTNGTDDSDVTLRNLPVTRVKSAKASNRVSKVMENVKMFEQGGQTPELKEANEMTIRHDSANSRASINRKRAPYLEVWQCKTGDEEPKTQSNEDINENTAIDVISGNKQLRNKGRPSSYPVRDNYVEVWTCSTGEEKDPTNPDLDVELLGLNEQTSTLPTNAVKLRNKELRNDAANNRLTWPSPATQTSNHHDNSMENKSSAPKLYPTLSETDDSNFVSVRSLDHAEGVPNLYVKDVGVSSEEDMAVKPPAFKSATIATGREYDPEVDDLRHALTTSDRISNTFDRRFLNSDVDDEFSYNDEYDIDYGVDAASEICTTDSDHSDSEVASNEITRSEDDLASYSSKEELGEEGEEFTEEDFDTLEQEQEENVSKDSIDSPQPDRRSFAQSNPSSLVDYQKVRNIAEAEKLRMRWWVVSSLLESEETYLEYLNTLLLYMKPIKATIDSSQPVMSAQDFDILFYRVLDLHKLHAQFYEGLKPKLDNWSADTCIAVVFQKLASKLSIYADYVKNYKRAQQTAEKCAKENTQFAYIIESLKVQTHKKAKGSESITLTGILYKPVERVMRHTLVLQDLLRHTPHRHPDHHILREVLKHGQLFLEKISQQASHNKKAPSASSQAAARAAEREMKKDGYLVEVTPDKQRKLRHVFLFSDLLLCTKPKNASGVFHSKDTYECKWYVPLADLSFKPIKDVEGVTSVPDTNDEELQDLTIKASGLKREIASEKKKLLHRHKKNLQNQKNGEGAPKTSLTSRNLERLRRKLTEIEGQIILAAPNLPLRVFHMQGKCYMFLMSSDFERDEWTEAIIKTQENCFKSFSLTTLEVQNLLTSCVRNRKMSNVSFMLGKDDGDMLSGYITVTIHSGGGFLHPCNPYVKLEVDSYGHFQTRGTTNVCENTQTPVWEDEFEFEVDGAQILRILCYDSSKGRPSYEGDVLIAKGLVKLSQDSLKSDDWSNEKVLINGLDIGLSMKFTPREQSLLRVPSHKSNGVFGVKLGIVAKRENGSVPRIVKKCIMEIERRGMHETGIYRVSGVASGVQLLKASFDSHRKDIDRILQEVDINSVAGVLKLYFRELPEPLFTDKRYSDFVDAINLADPETKENTIHRLLADLPLSNYQTFVNLRNHLINVSKLESENKMSLHNLATVFGPTLLRPAESNKNDKLKEDDFAILNNLRLGVHYQMGVLLYCLEMNEMPTHSSKVQHSESTVSEAKQSSSTRVKSPLRTSVSVSSDDRRHVPRQSSIGGARPDKPSKPLQRGQTDTTFTPPKLNPRHHPYETLDGLEKGNPLISNPMPIKKPEPGAKPTPAPRKPSTKLIREKQYLM